LENKVFDKMMLFLRGVECIPKFTLYSLPTSYKDWLVCTSEVSWTLRFTQLGPFKGKRNQYY